MELNEEQLENVLGGANKEVINDKVLENKELYRPRSVEEIEREKEELLQQREELLNSKENKM